MTGSVTAVFYYDKEFVDPSRKVHIDKRSRSYFKVKITVEQTQFKKMYYVVYEFICQARKVSE